MIHQLEHPLIESIEEEVLGPLDSTLFILLEEIKKRVPAILQRCKQKMRTPHPASLPTLMSDNSTEPHSSPIRGTPSLRAAMVIDESSLPNVASPHPRVDKGKAPLRDLPDFTESSRPISIGSIATQTPSQAVQILDQDILDSFSSSVAPSVTAQSLDRSLSATENCIINSTMDTLNCLPGLNLFPSSDCFTELFNDVTLIPGTTNYEDLDVTEWLSDTFPVRES